MNGRVVVIGAGPYGLSVAACLAQRGVPNLVLGLPMATWRRMPADMLLKSSWSASSLGDLDGAYTLDQYVAATGVRRAEPIPLRFFQDYCDWFRRSAVPAIDQTCVSRLRPGMDGFAVELSDGRVIAASRVVVATGLARFAHVPAFAAGLPAAVARHTMDCPDPRELAGATVAVIGAGQSGLEWAALLHEAGARVELISRGPVAWVNRALYDLHPLSRHLFYAPSDVGPAGISRLVDRQFLVHRLPAGVRHRLTRISVRPAGATWLRPRVEGVVRLTARTGVEEATASGDGVRLQLTDGSARHVDHLILGTGFRPQLDRLEFLGPELRSRIAAASGLPRLNRHFESSVPGLHFVGALAEHSFGPLSRFVAGATLAARQVACRAEADRGIRW